jgi:hypothetical protein
VAHGKRVDSDASGPVEAYSTYQAVDWLEGLPQLIQPAGLTSAGISRSGTRLKHRAASDGRDQSAGSRIV